MQHLKQILELEQLRNQAFIPPHDLLDRVEELEERGEPWCVLEVWTEGREEPSWLAVFPDGEAAILYVEGEGVKGKWDQEHEVFLPEEGEALDLQGRPVSLSSLEAEEEEEDEAWWEEAEAKRKPI